MQTYTLTSQQLAEMLQVGLQGIRQYRSGLRNQPILQGLPEPVQQRPQLMWLRADIEAWLESKRTFRPEPVAVSTEVACPQTKRGRGRPRKGA